MIDMKVRKKMESFYILGYLLGSYHKTLAISNLFYSNFAKFGPSYFSRSKFGENSPLKQTWAAVKWPYYIVLWMKVGSSIISLKLVSFTLDWN
jgi:hypothetical protein